MAPENHGIADPSDLLRIQEKINNAVHSGQNRLAMADGLARACLEFPCLECVWIWSVASGTGKMKLEGSAGTTSSVSHLLDNLDSTAGVATHLVVGHEVILDWEDVWGEYSQIFRHANLNQVGVLPLKRGSGTIGAMGFASTTAGDFDHRLLEAMRHTLRLFGLRLEVLELEEHLAVANLNLGEVLGALEDPLIIVSKYGEILKSNFPEQAQDGAEANLDKLLPGGVRILQQYRDHLPTQGLVGGSSLNQSRLIKSNGHLIPVEVAVKKGFWHGQVAYFMSCRDISRQLVMEKERDRLGTAIEQTADSIVITNSSGSIQYTNPAFSELTGYSAEEVLGANPRILKSGRHDREFYGQMWSTIRRGEIWKGRMVNRKKNGEEYWEVISISPVRGSSGIITHYVGVKHDITHEMKLEERLRQSQKLEAIGTLAGGIAHDFNNILYALLGNSQLALDDIPENHPAHLPLMEIVKAGDRGSALVSKMMTFGQRAERQMKVTSLGPIITEVMELTRASLPSTIEIQLNLAEECPDILLDEGQIHQVVLNLCTNAAHAMTPQGGLLSLELENVAILEDTPEEILGVPAGKYLRLKVSDTGLGMDATVMNRIFEPYFTTKKPNEGTGLGLASVHGIVRNHHGRIFVESTLQEGTTFTLYFPVAKVSVPKVKVELQEEKKPMGQGRVMVVDDENMIIDVVVRGLKKMGFQVTGFTDGIEALEVFRENPAAFDVVVTDQTMPGITGFELAAHVSSIRPDLPIILSTGYSKTINESELRMAGISHFLPKPLKINELATLLCEINKPSLTTEEV